MSPVRWLILRSATLHINPDCQDWYAELTAHHLVTCRPSCSALLVDNCAVTFLNNPICFMYNCFKLLNFLFLKYFMLEYNNHITGTFWNSKQFGIQSRTFKVSYMYCPSLYQGANFPLGNMYCPSLYQGATLPPGYLSSVAVDPWHELSEADIINNIWAGHRCIMDWKPARNGLVFF